MPIKYSCFISYPHGRADLMKTFVKQLKEALEAYLEPWVPAEVCIDEDLLKAGDLYNKKIATAICQSVCMIVVYSPIYAEHPYCLQEYRAMELVQERRKHILEGTYDEIADYHTLIYPIILKGEKDDLPPKIKDNIHYKDFSKFTLATLDISRNPDYINAIEDIARAIYHHYKVFKELNEDCNSFALPLENEAKDLWIKSFGVPSEAKRLWIKSTKPVGFPGRDTT